MKTLIRFLIILLFISGCKEKGSIPDSINEGPISLHPENPHYFLYKGKTTVLITSAEHYGAVLNLDFDFSKYLNTLADEGMNYTRIFTGTYFEILGESFGIKNNTLAPGKNRVWTPWGIVISDLSGNFKYDLSVWNTAYFDRLKSFLELASENEIIVEVTLFSSIYQDSHWEINPQNPVNNININTQINRHDAHTLNNGALFSLQEAFVRKIVQELNDFDNFFFEIQNEPWSDRNVPVYNILNKEELRENDWTTKTDFADEASLVWQEKIAGIIKDEEKNLPKKHLIAQNFCNYLAPVPEVNENIDIINFHYAWPEAVQWNYAYDRVLGFDESGFAGSDDKVYRRQAWKFLLSGGALFNNLDYSFYAGNEDGKGINDAPGGGSAKLRQELKILSEFMHSFELEKLKPNRTAVLSSPGLIPFVMSDGNNSFAIYLRAVGTDKFKLELFTGEGSFSVQILNTLNGEFSDAVKFKAMEEKILIEGEIPEGELALRIEKES